MNMNELNNQIAKAVTAYDARFMEEHGDMPDFGACGAGVVLIGFGRKRKIKQEAIDAGLIRENGTWSSFGAKMFVAEIPRGNVPTQYGGYYAQRARIAADVIKEHFESHGVKGVEVMVHTWVD